MSQKWPPNKVLYSIRVEDAQQRAMERMDRKLTDTEMQMVANYFSEFDLHDEEMWWKRACDRAMGFGLRRED
jgi:hypothetical protein